MVYRAKVIRIATSRSQSKHPELRTRTTIYLKKDLWNKLKMQALKESKSAYVIIEKLIEQYLSEMR
jgi:hypothetical protein